MAVRAIPLPRGLPRLERRFVIAGLLAALAGALVLVVTQPPQRTAVLVAARDLPVGHRLVGNDVAVRYVEDPKGHVQGDSLGELEGYALAVPLLDDQPLVASMLKPPAVIDSSRVLSLSVPVAQAALGRIAPGSRIDVYATTQSPGVPAITERIAARVYVIDATADDSGGLRDEVSLLLAVNEPTALLLTNASHVGELDIVVVGG